MTAVDEQADRVIRFAARSLGSALRLQVRMDDRSGRDPDALAGVAWDRVWSEFDAVDIALSRFRADSELTALNQLAGTRQVVRVSGRLRTALAMVHRAGRLTGGRFDARVLTTLERIGEHGAALDPRGERPSVAVANPDARFPAVVPDAPLDMGGVGKGLALRWAAAAATAALPGDAGVMLEAGGDVVAAGIPPGPGWLVGIEDPVADPGPDAPPIAVAALHDGAIATSSIRVRNWIGPDGRPVHHLIDPRTGEPARTGLVAVTVAGADPAWSEVWSKALFLAGRGAIGDEARSRGIAAWWVDETGHLGMTPEARVRSVWVAEDRLG